MWCQVQVLHFFVFLLIFCAFFSPYSLSACLPQDAPFVLFLLLLCDYAPKFTGHARPNIDEETTLTKIEDSFSRFPFLYSFFHFFHYSTNLICRCPPICALQPHEF
ncbi:hypothetical protein DFH27DRAFT_382687 [Peziza echinospora]|nr:hypothetical protein DFH27DRAFT_382687 [Peziza echinospora]